MRSWKFLLFFLASTLCFAAQPDRITGPIDSSQMVPLTGNVHSLAQPRFDLGRTDGSKVLYGVTLAFRPSAAQQQALNNLLAQQQDRSSPNVHKWLTPAQFADRFGMTRNDIGRVTAWLESQGFTVTSIANSRNQISFDGTVAQVESVFGTEIHNYLVDSEIHFANSTNPSVPAALAGSVLAMGHLHNFSPKPRVKIQSHFTSDQTGNHFLTPGDFATIYNIPAGLDGTGQSIAVVGQSAVNLTDLANFRSAAGMTPKAPQMILYPSTSTSAHCSGDEGESDLDLEWSGGVAKNANIIFVYAGLVGSDACGHARQNSVWDALFEAVNINAAPVISISYGFCEQGLPAGFPQTVRGWAQQANAQGQTIVASTGDSGAADCDGPVASATQGLAVDIPAAIPEVTGMGGNEFFGDPPSTSNTTYWLGSSSSDIISSAVMYIPEEAWNDTAADGALAASGGGASTLFPKPTWQTGTGVPNDLKRDVPDLALSASANHDAYLICTPTDSAGNPSCTKGFRDSSTNGYLDAVGGTSCAAPSFAAIVALLNQSLGASGLGNINPQLYSLAASNPAAFHDVTTGNNIVPCTSGTPNCPSGTTQFGFTAGTGYDQVTGLGSVDANALAVAWKATLAPDYQLTAGALSPSSVPAGQSTSATLTISPVTGSTGTVVNFSPSSCTGLPTGATCSFNPASVTFDGINNATTTLTISTLANMAPSGPQTITITPTNSSNTSTTVNLTVTATNQTFTLSSTNGATFAVPVGGTATVNVTVIGQGSPISFVTNNATALPLTYSCSGIPPSAEISCQLPSNGQPTNLTAVTISLKTTPVTTQLMPLGGSRIFYAVLLPGLFGVVFAAGSRARGLRLLSLILILGFSTLWLGACGGSSNSNSLKNAGTPPGQYAVTINATTGAPTGGTALTFSLPITLNVTAH